MMRKHQQSSPWGRMRGGVLSSLIPPSLRAPELMGVRTTCDPAVSIPITPVRPAPTPLANSEGPG